MALHFHSQAWQVHDGTDGLRVTFADGNLAAEVLPTLADELFDLACASGRRQLSLDLAGLTVPVAPLAPLAGKLIELHERLRASGRGLVLLNADPALANLFGKAN
jgi:hypothetical protein